MQHTQCSLLTATNVSRSSTMLSLSVWHQKGSLICKTYHYSKTQMHLYDPGGHHEVYGKHGKIGQLNRNPVCVWDTFKTASSAELNLHKSRLQADSLRRISNIRHCLNFTKDTKFIIGLSPFTHNNRISHNMSLNIVSKMLNLLSQKNVHFCLCQNFVKFPPTLVSFGL